MSNVKTFQRHMQRKPGKVYLRDKKGHLSAPFEIDPVKPYKALPRAALFHYWHPDRTGVEPCPPAFAATLHEIHPDLAITRPPMRAPTRTHCWLVWYRKPTIKHPLSPGWLLLFPWLDPATNEPIALDDRVLANIYMRSAIQFGNGKKYFEHCVAEMQRTEQRAEDLHQDDLHQRRKDFWNFTKISTAGRGNKFALHHDGTLLPSRNERNWINEIEYRRMPEESRREYKDRRTGFNLTNRVSVDMGAASIKQAALIEQRIFDTQLAIQRLSRETRALFPVPVRQRKLG